MSHVVTLRLNDEEYKKLKQAVQRTEVLQSEFIRNALSNQVNAVMQIKSIKQESEDKEVVSKNNAQMKDRYATKQVPHYGIRKLSVGVASVLLSTTLYMGITAHADTTVPVSPQPAIDQPASTKGGVSTNNVTANAQPTKAMNATQPAKNSNIESDNNGSAIKPSEQSTDPTALMTNFAVVGQPVDDTHNPVTTTLTSKFTWAIHYTDESGKKLLPDSVITHDYTRTDTGDQMGNWVYVPDSVKVTGTSNAGYNINKPDFKFNQTSSGTAFDYATWQAAAASIDGYTPKYGSVGITDQLPKNPESLHATSTVDSGTHEFTFVYTKQPTKVTINYVDDEQGEKVVGTGTVSGKTGTEVTITPQLPKGYMLTPDKDLPSTYMVTDDANQAVTIHVQKQFVDLSDTDPQAKQTRTITLHYVYGTGDKQGQPAFDDAVLDVYYHRTATLDRATNQTTYGDWMWDQSQGDPSTPGYHVVSGKWTNLPQSWANVTADVPSIKGYYADLGQNDPTNTNHVPSNTWVFPTYNNAGSHGATAYLDGQGYEVGPTHTVKYMPNQTTVTVNYVDDDNNGVNVDHQSWNGTTGQHIDLTLTPPENYVLTPGWVNPSSYDFDGVNSSWYTVHVKHKTQDVTVQEPKDQVTKVTRLTQNHLYGNGPHKGEKFAEPDIFDLAWKRTATKDLVTGEVTFGNWQVNWNDSKSVQGQLTARPVPYQEVDGMLYAGKNGYSCLGDNAHSEFVRADGSVVVKGWNDFGWQGVAELEAYPVLNYYYGPDQVKIPIYYVDTDTGQKVAEKINNDALTGDDFRDGNTVTIDQSKLTSLPTTLTGYQLLPGQTLPTSYKIDTFAGVKAIEVQVVKDRSVKVTFVDDDNKGAVVGTPTTITGHTGGDPVALNLTVPDKYELADGQQLPTSYTFTKGSGDLTIHLVHQERSVTVRFIDDRFGKFVDGRYLARQVGQAITLTGRNGDTVDLNLTVPGKYQLADGQQLPTSYTFTKGNGDVTIHLVHKIVQRDATIDVQLSLEPLVRITDDHRDIDVVPQTKWTPQLADEFKTTDDDDLSYKLMSSSSVEAGTLTGHVNYDLVDEKVVSFGDDWTTLNLNGQTYQMPNGTDVVNGVTLEYNDRTSEKFRDILCYYPNTDPDYVNRPWHGYLSVNATNNSDDDRIVGMRQFGLQAGLVGDEPNALAKATGDRAATGVEMGDKKIDLSLLQGLDLRSDSFSEQDSQLQAKTFLPVAGVYIPYVEKTATRTIKITTPDGKTTTVEQTATLAKQVVLGDADVHQNWTTGEWASYDVPTIPGYTASQSNVAKETVTGTTKDQTINITYTANPQTAHINYVDAQGKLIHTTTVNGKTDQTVEVPNEVPDGWMLYSGQSIPKSITFQAVNNDRDYVVKHVQSFVLSTAPKETGTIIEGTKAKTYPAGVSDADLNKTVTRTILVKDANGRTVNTKTQTVHFVRNAIVDAVTGHVDYLGWSENGSHIFAAYIPVPKNGYTINSAKMATVTPKDTDSTVELTYKTIPKTITVEYMTTDGKQVASQNVKADDNNQVKFVAPDGYLLATNTNIVDVSDLNNNIYRVLVRANEQTYTAGSTNIPKNVKDLTKVVTRTIVIVMPNGHRRTIKQRVTFERTATVKSDGSVVYTDYQPVGHDAFNHIFIAHRFGYNLNFSDGSKSVARVNHVTADTPDQTIVVTYVRKNANQRCRLVNVQINIEKRSATKASFKLIRLTI